MSPRPSRTAERPDNEHKRAAGRLASQHAVTHVLAGSAGLREAAPRLIRVICETADWDLGAFWEVDEPSALLRCVSVVSCSGKRFPEFEAAMRGRTFSPGTGLPGRTFSDAAPVWISDVTLDSNFPRLPIAAKEGLHGAFALPIVVSDEVSGVLEFFSSHTRPPDPALLELLTGFGSQIGQFTERKRAEHAVRERDRRFREIIDALPAAVYTTDADGRLTHFNPAAVAFSGRVPELGTDRWCVSWKMFRPDGSPLPHDECPMAVALKEGLILRGVEAAAERPDGTRLWFTPHPALLRDAEGRVVGGVNMLVDVTERRRSEALLTGQKRVFEMMAMGASLAEVLTELVRVVEAHDDGLLGSILVRRPDADRFGMGIGPSLPADYIGALSDAPTCAPYLGPCGRAADLGEAVVAADVTADTRWAPEWRELASSAGLRTCYSLPIRASDGTVLGAFASYYRTLRDPEPADPRLLATATHVAGIAIERARAEEALRRSETQLEAELADSKLLQRISALLISSEDVEGLYDELLGAAMRIMGADLASMQMVVPDRGEGGELLLLASRGFSEEAVRFWTRVRADSRCTCGAALRSGERVVVSDIEQSDLIAGSEDLAAYRAAGIRSVQSTPLVSRRGKLLGMVSTHWYRVHQPSERDLRLLDILARQAADLIERKRAEEALHHRTAQFEALVDQAPLGVYLVDADFRIREVNPVALPVFGDVPGGVIGRDLGEVMHALWEPRYADELVRIFRHTLETGEPYVTSERAEYRSDRGVMEWYEWRLDRLTLPDGRYGLVCYFRDISADVQARERLRQATKMEAIGRLAGGLAHDFNNQLHALSGFAEFVARDPGLSGRSRRDLLEVEKAAERMASLTRQLLAFSRQQVLQPETLDLNETVRDSQALLQRLIGADIELRHEGAPEPVWTRADRAQLLQVLMNLVVNARDAMPDGGSITIETARRRRRAGELDAVGGTQVPAGEYAELTVADTGDGIAPEALPHVFEPFFTTKEVGKGTGLGLATVHGIVTQSRGYVWAGSRPGGGARFAVLLPLESEPQRAATGSPRQVPAAGRAARLLVVEDEDAVRATIVRRLEDEGYEVQQARHGREALERLERAEGAVDVVISDMVMPVMSGRELGGRLGEDWPAVSVVWMSGYPRDDALHQGVLRDDQPFLQKPVAGELLVETVRRVVESRADIVDRRVDAFLTAR